MNKLLADAIGALNGVLAIGLVLAGGVIGAGAGALGGRDFSSAGFLVGGLMGALVAVLVCGGLALLISIRDELRTMRLALAGTAPNNQVDSRLSALMTSKPAAAGNGPAAATVTFEGREIALDTTNVRQFAVLDDGRVLLKTRAGEVRAFADMPSAEAYTGVKFA